MDLRDFPQNVFAGIVIAFVIAVMCVSIFNYIDVASSCNGVVVRDYMNQPVCIPANNIAIPIR